MRLIFVISVLVFIGCSKHTISSVEAQKTTDQNVKFLQTSQTQLSKPVISVDSVFFRSSAHIELEFNHPEAEVYYSINSGIEKKYNAPIKLTQSGSVSIQAKKVGYEASETVILNLVKTNNKIKNTVLRMDPAPHENYPGEGPASLIDLKKGNINFRDGKLWSGFQSEVVEFELEFEKAISISKIYCSLLSDQNSWIFMPRNIQIWDTDQQIGTIEIENPEIQENTSMRLIPIPIKKGVYKNMMVRILNLKEIPGWHPGKGSIPWLFIDEIAIE